MSKVKHGLSRTKEYNAWIEIKDRCRNPKCKSYDRYGARGIDISQEWFESFVLFIDHIGLAPSKRHSIDRINNNLGYIPGNVRWATSIEQNNNLSSNKILEFNGDKMTMAQWARKLGKRYPVIQGRIRRGWSAFDALSTP